MRCEKLLDRYDLLDAGEEPGFLMKLHLSTCPGCRAEIERLTRALEEYRSLEEPGDSPLESAEIDIDERVMSSVRLLPKPKRELHARDWVISGIVIVASMSFIPYDANFSRFKEVFGVSYALPLSLVLGIALTVYGAVFIAAHMEELEPLVHPRLPRT